VCQLSAETVKHKSGGRPHILSASGRHIFQLYKMILSLRLNEQTGELRMLAGATKGDHVLRVNVRDKKWQKTVTSTVTANVVYLNDSVVTSSASIRLAGTL